PSKRLGHRADSRTEASTACPSAVRGTWDGSGIEPGTDTSPRPVAGSAPGEYCRRSHRHLLSVSPESLVPSGKEPSPLRIHQPRCNVRSQHPLEDRQDPRTRPSLVDIPLLEATTPLGGGRPGFVVDVVAEFGTETSEVVPGI